MNTIKKFYQVNLPVPRLNSSDFSPCGSISNGEYKNNVTVAMFYVPMCRFCQEFAPELKKFAENYTKAKVVAVDMSENSSLIDKSKNFPYSLGQFPTVIIFYNGNPCGSYTGVRTAQALANYISKYVTSPQTCTFKFVPCE